MSPSAETATKPTSTASDKPAEEAKASLEQEKKDMTPQVIVGPGGWLITVEPGRAGLKRRLNGFSHAPDPKRRKKDYDEDGFGDAGDPPAYELLDFTHNKEVFLEAFPQAIKDDGTISLEGVGQVIHRRTFKAVVFLDAFISGSMKICEFALTKKIGDNFKELKAMKLGDVFEFTSDLDPFPSKTFTLRLLSAKVTKRYRYIGFTPWDPTNRILAGRKSTKDIFCSRYRKALIKGGVEPKSYMAPPECITLNCQFRHHPTALELNTLRKNIRHRSKVLSEQDKFNQELAAEKKEDGATQDDVVVTPLESKKKRASLFCDWLVNKFGLELLQKHGVLDVAGGQGLLSYNLSLKGIPCWVVDPRADEALQKRAIRKKRQKEDAAEVIHIPRLFDGELFEDKEMMETMLKRAVIVGMHPDQATEAIFRWANTNKKPYAVLPCCVFPTLFPRKMKNGKRVVTFIDFIGWLRETFPQTKVDRLGFKGRDHVLYHEAGRGRKPLVPY